MNSVRKSIDRERRKLTDYLGYKKEDMLQYTANSAVFTRNGDKSAKGLQSRRADEIQETPHPKRMT